MGWIRGSGRSARDLWIWNPFQYSYLEKSHGQRDLVGYSPWDHKELDMTEWVHRTIEKKKKEEEEEEEEANFYLKIFLF